MPRALRHWRLWGVSGAWFRASGAAMDVGIRALECYGLGFRFRV